MSTDTKYKNMSPFEAANTKRWLEEQLSTGIETPSSGLMAGALADLNEAFPDEVAFPSHPAEPSNEPLSASLQLEDSDVAPAKTKAPPSPLAQTDLAPKPLSPMDPIALKSVVAIGHISPAAPSTSFILDHLRLPVENGTINSLSLNEYREAQRVYFDAPSSSTKKEYAIEFPADARLGNFSKIILPVPFGCGVVSNKDNNRISPPTSTDPLVWRVERTTPHFKYEIGQASNDSPLLKVSRTRLPDLLPIESETYHNQRRLGLPTPLHKELLDASEKKDFDRIFNLVSNYMVRHDDSLQSTSFRYVCHREFGRFLNDQSDHLPLIIGELKVGHCDYLSWYCAYALRAYAVPAWLSTDIVSTKDGKAFNAASLHARTVYLDNNMNLSCFDPTKWVRTDPAYSQSVLGVRKIEKLHHDFCDAKTDTERREALQAFNSALQELRKKSVKTKSGTTSSQNLASALSHQSGELGESKLSKRETGPAFIILDSDSAPASMEDAKLLLDHVHDTFAKNTNNRNPFDEISRLDKNSLKALKLALDCLHSLGVRLPNDFTDTDIITYFNIAYLKQEPRIELSVAQYLASYQDTSTPFPLGAALPSLIDSNISIDSITRSLPLDERDTAAFYEYRNLFSLNRSGESGSIRNYSRLIREKISQGIYPISANRVEGVDFSDNSNVAITSEKEVDQLCNDILHFYVDYQRSTLDREHRCNFLQELGINEETFRKVVINKLDIDESVPRITGVPPPDPMLLKMWEKWRGVWADMDVEDPVVVHNIREIIRKMDFNPSRGSEHMMSEARPYVSGDDLRRIDWTAWARTDKFFVKGSPSIELAVATPLYVITEGIHNQITLFEYQLVLALRREARERKRVIYLGSAGPRSNNSYVRITPNGEPAEAILSRLENARHDGQESRVISGALLPSGRLPKNILFVAHSFSRLASYHYLYGTAAKTAYLWTQDKRFHMSPRIKDSFIDGF